nr:uncharacterized protein LOC107434599 isoform X1 [Ziziphus jujuba var. spinosa]
MAGGMENIGRFVGIAMVVLAQVCSFILNKRAMSKGLSEFALVIYSYSFSILILLHSSFLFHRSERPPLSLSVLSSLFLMGGLLGNWKCIPWRRDYMVPKEKRAFICLNIQTPCTCHCRRRRCNIFRRRSLFRKLGWWSCYCRWFLCCDVGQSQRREITQEY